MTSHQHMNEQGLRSPINETQKVNADEIMFETSPTGIMGFPDTSNTNGKPLLAQRSGLPILHSLDHPEDEDQMDLQRRLDSLHKYWEGLEQEFEAGRQEYIIPRGDNVWGGFSVTKGQVLRMVQEWNVRFQHVMPTMEFPLTPEPGDNVRQWVNFFNRLAHENVHQQAMEPFVIYKTLSDKLRDRVAILEAQCTTCTVPQHELLESRIVYRRVSPKLQPLVTWWDAAFQPPLTPEPMEPVLHHKNRRVVVMANLMQKKIEHMDDTKERVQATIPHSNLLVTQMVTLLEAMNSQIKTGIYNGNPLDADHVHHVKSLPLVC